MLCRREDADSYEAANRGSPARIAILLSALALAIGAVAYVARGPSTPALHSEATAAPGRTAGAASASEAQPPPAPETHVPRAPTRIESAAELHESPPEALPPVAYGGEPRAQGPGATKQAGPGASDPARQADKEREKRAELERFVQRVPVVVYSTTWCPVCVKAKAWLRQRGISYTDRDVEASDEARRDQLVLNGKGSVPTIDVDGQILVGFGARNLEAALQSAAQRRANRF